MIDGLGRYPEYKDSSLPWVGKIPNHWKLERAKGLFQKMDRPAQLKDEVVTCFRDGTVTLRKNRRLTGFTESIKEIGYQGVRRGDLVIHAMDAFAGAVGVSDSDGKCTPVYAVCEPRRGANPYYYAYIVREMARSQWIAALARGIRERSTDFRFDGFAAQPLPFPPTNEQREIANFLRHANRRIERYIRAKKKLIALLNEQKQAIINRVVTRGLDPNVRLKSSGIPWLGQIPEHWEVSRVKNEFYCFNQRRIPLSSTERGRMTNRQYDYYGASGVIDKVDDYLFDDELLLIAEDGANLVLRNLPLAVIARGKFWVNNHAHILKPKRGNLEYLANVLETLSYRPWITGAAQPKLTQDRLMGIAIAVAPVDEQQRIMVQLTEETIPLRAAIARTEGELELIREYRTRLVADVATGQLDVREAAAKLPDESVELEPFDDIEGSSEEQDISSSDTSLDLESAETEL